MKNMWDCTITGEYKGMWGGEGDKKLIFGPLVLELRPKTLKPNLKKNIVKNRVFMKKWAKSDEFCIE